MSEELRPAPSTSLPSSDDVQKMSGAQAGAKLNELGAQQDFRNKLFAGDGKTAELFRQLAEKRSQDEVATSLIDAAADPNVPLPPGGGPNKNGMSRRDEIEAARWMLSDGATPAEAAEFEIGLAMVSPQDFHTIERSVRARALGNPEFVKRYLGGDPEARALMDRWHRIATLSRPWPAAPTTGIVR